MSDASVLIVEDDPHLREALFDTLSAESVSVLTADSGPAALDILDSEPVGLVISDLQMEPMDGATLLRNIHERHPRLPAILMTAYGTIENAVDVMRNGAADYLVKPFEARELKAVVDRYLAPVHSVGCPIAADRKSRELLRIAERVAATDATVMIGGESGSGKEVIARYIHECSQRREAPFVAINCAAIPENMLEAVLFGYEKGAFTGASGAHPGKFEQADGGTLLLDEVSEMDLNLQAKLLRVIQEKEVERIGGRKTIPLDVRVLATTNRDLKTWVAEGRFREDLYYRLNVFPLTVPPLRLRPDDVIPLAELFLERHAPGSVRPLSDAAARRLLLHRWPGNVRELDNLMQRALVLATGETIEDTDLAFEDAPADAAPVQVAGDDEAGLQKNLEEKEFQLILDALEETGGHKGRAAENLGISPRTLRYKLARIRERGVPIPGEGHE